MKKPLPQNKDNTTTTVKITKKPKKVHRKALPKLVVTKLKASATRKPIRKASKKKILAALPKKQGVRKQFGYKKQFILKKSPKLQIEPKSRVTTRPGQSIKLSKTPKRLQPNSLTDVKVNGKKPLKGFRYFNKRQLLLRMRRIANNKKLRV